MSGIQFDELKQGETPTFLQTFFANTVLKAINALNNMTIRWADTNQVSYGDTEVTITLEEPYHRLHKFPYPPFAVKYPLRWSKIGGLWQLRIDGFTREVRYCGKAGANFGNLYHTNEPIPEEV